MARRRIGGRGDKRGKTLTECLMPFLGPLRYILAGIPETPSRLDMLQTRYYFLEYQNNDATIFGLLIYLSRMRW